MVRFITYREKEYPIVISFSALTRCKKEIGVDISESFELEHLEPLLYYALIAGHKAEKKDMPFERDEVEFILDEVLYSFTKMIPEFFSDMEKQGGQTGVKKKK